MKIALISTRHGRGLTTVASLLSDMSARKYGMPCVLTHTGTRDVTMSRYLSLARYRDNTLNIRQIAKLLEVNEMSHQDLKDYTIKKGKLGIFDPHGDYISDTDATVLINMVLKQYQTGLAFIDVADEIYDTTVESVINDSDFYICVITQSRDNIEQLKELKNSEYWKKIEEAGYLILVNQFNNNIMPLSLIAKELGVRQSKMLKLSYNPYIVKQSNEGNLLSTNDQVIKKDPRFINLHSDLMKCLKVIALNLGIAYKWSSPNE